MNMSRFDIKLAAQKDKRGELAAAIDVAMRIRSLGYQAYFAGGCVRDLLLGREPKDIDIATDAVPMQTKSAWPGAKYVGEAFGVSLVKWKGHQFEVATFRSDGDYSDGRRPDNVKLHTSAEEDARRRDFTINALFMDPETGEVIDYVGGVDDLNNGIIRAVGDPDSRFREDHLRMLRAVRFAAQLGFEVDSTTMQAIHDSRAHIRDIAKERVWIEMTKLLMSRHPSLGFRLLYDSGLFEVLFSDLNKVFRSMSSYGRISEMLRLLERYRCHKPDPLSGQTGSDLWWSEALCWSILFYQLDCRELVDAELLKWPIPNDLSRKISSLVTTAAKPKQGPNNFANLSLADQKRWLRRPNLYEHILLWVLRLQAEWVPIPPDTVLSIVDDIAEEEIFRTNCETAKSMSPPVLLDGNDLQELGYSPGPQFSEMIAALEEEQLMERVLTREAAVEFIESNYSK